jgi:hypothetical protein
MSESRRVDLTQDLDSLLLDVKAATEQVKQRQEADKRKQVNAAKKEKSTKQSALIIGIAAVALIVLAYFVVFANSNNNNSIQASASSVSTPAPQVSVKAPGAPIGSGPSTNRMPVTTPTRAANVPSDTYEQPGGGM